LLLPQTRRFLDGPFFARPNYLRFDVGEGLPFFRRRAITPSAGKTLRSGLTLARIGRD
jgi:hypothetical protein